jgi:hypothetical protein
MFLGYLKEGGSGHNITYYGIKHKLLVKFGLEDMKKKKTVTPVRPKENNTQIQN